MAGLDLGHSKLFTYFYFCKVIKKNNKKWKEFCKEFCKKLWKKIILGTSEAWSMRRSSHRLSVLYWRLSDFCTTFNWVLKYSGYVTLVILQTPKGVHTRVVSNFLTLVYGNAVPIFTTLEQSGLHAIKSLQINRLVIEMLKSKIPDFLNSDTCLCLWLYSNSRTLNFRINYVTFILLVVKNWWFWNFDSWFLKRLCKSGCWYRTKINAWDFIFFGDLSFGGSPHGLPHPAQPKISRPKKSPVLKV